MMNKKVWPFLKTGIIAVAAFVAMLILTNLPLLSLLELKGLDFLFLLRGPLPPPPEIVIVAIDESSFAEIGKQWPWPRSIHAQLVDQLKNAGASVIGFDILFAEPSDPAEDEALRRAMQEASNVVLVSEEVIIDDPLFRHTLRVEPIEPFRRVAAFGRTTLQLDPDGTVRRVYLWSPDNPYFASQVARRYLAPAAPQRTTSHSSEGYRRGRLDPSAEVLINHLGPQRTIKTVSYYQALQHDQLLPPGIFDGKIVLVGRALQASPEPQRGAPDVFHTPFLLSATSPTPGVEIQATIIRNLLTGGFVTEPSPAVRLPFLLLLALIASLALLKLKPLTSLAAIGGLTILFLTTAALLFSSRNLWLPIFSGTLLLGLVYVGHLAVSVVSALRINELIKDTFGKYIDPRIVTNLLEQPEFINSGGERRVMTVFFCDMEKFSLLSETMTPAGLVAFVNQYLTLLSEPVRRYKGIIDKYVGDAIMAFWGPPFSAESEHAKLACFAALEQFSKLEEFRRMLPDLMGLRKGLPEVNIRVGVATGDVVVGNIGSNLFKNYTVMGDTVNIAARLESANKQYGTRLLISEHTQALAMDAIETREIDSIQVMGKSESVRVFELLARKGELKPAVAAVRDHFEQGLAAYRKQNWDQAQFHFNACLGIDPGDKPSLLFLTRLQHLRDTPPPENWDGVWALTEK